MSTFVGHVSLKFLTEADRAGRVLAAKELMLAFVAEGGFTNFVAVYEEGTENGGAHFHFELISAKSNNTLRRLIAKHFKKGTEEQWMSLKVADPAKLDRHALYLAKGFDGKKGSTVEVLWDTYT